MPRSFYIILAAQFFSALADNALLIGAIALLRDLHAQEQYEPLLRLVFTVSYVVLAAFVGAFADSMPKGRVMLISNTIKIAGCLLLLVSYQPVHPLIAYAIVGIGAAAYSPAKYGILTEMLPPRLLVVANGWIEGLTVVAIILGTLLGGILITPSVVAKLLSIDFPGFDTPIRTGPQAAILIIGIIYLIAAWFNLHIPDTGVDHKPIRKTPMYLVYDFVHSLRLLWRDKLGQISLVVTTLFWGAGAALQFIVLKWADEKLHMPLEKASVFQGVVAVGIALGSIVAAKTISLEKSAKVLPVGIFMGVVTMIMVFVTNIYLAMILLVVIGAIAGFFVVPMNALLQHRGHILMGAGHSIAVQNFNENIGILAMMLAYTQLVAMDASVDMIVVLFALFVMGVMALVMGWHKGNMKTHGPEIERLLTVARSSNAPRQH